MSLQKPTIIVFSRGARAEREAKRLLPAASSHELRLHSALIEQSLAISLEVGVDVVVNSPGPEVRSDVRWTPQEGSSFSSRLQHAIESGQNSKWLVVAADCPELRVRYLQKAVEAVNAEPDTVVIGPSRRGGIYLIASNSDISNVIRRVRWRTSAARKDLIRLSREAGKRIVVLERSDDLNRPADLESWLGRDGSAANLALHAIRGELKTVLRVSRSRFSQDRCQLLGRPFSQRWNRPPPASFPA